MFDAQLEMSFETKAVCFSGRRSRQSRAQWWFHRMRQLVDHAIDWPPTPLARPEQMWLPASGLQARSAGAFFGHEASLCEQRGSRA